MINWIAIASMNLALAVALGAFGAHGLKNIATAEQLAWWQTGTLYFFFHALGLLIAGVLIKYFDFNALPAWLLQTGILLFAGSLYCMALGAPRWFGAITPIGGLFMIAGWVMLAIVAFKKG